jgi:hypothetical protein
MIHVQIAREQRQNQEQATHKVVAGDTLQSIAKTPEYGLKSWHELALYNWGTVVWTEVNRALSECIGCSQIKEDPGKTVLAPLKNETPEILIPKPWASVELDAKDELAQDRLHVLQLKVLRPANAISITKLDKWFIPAAEDCNIQYRLEGLKLCADKVELAVYGSNYCECTDWNKGLGTYSPLPDTPIFEQAEGNPAEERKPGAILVPDADTKKKGRWKGQASAGHGILGVKPARKIRHINVAFSPYTVLLRYYKDKADKKAALVLLPFWPQWQEAKTEKPSTGTDAGANVSIAWSNPAKAERGGLVIEDKDGQVVFAAPLPSGKLGAGNQTMVWNKQYQAGASNSRMRPNYLAADGPYKYRIFTFVFRPKPDSLKVEWLVKNTSRLVRGLVVIVNGKDEEVFRAPLPPAKLAQSNDDSDKRAFTWDGKYTPGVTNSLGGDSIIPEDMPYRAQIQAHTGVAEPKGLALAAMHTEVRLAVHPNTIDARDPAYSYIADGSSIGLSLGPAYTGKTPTDKTSDLWAQIKLTEAGYYPGPVRGGAHAQYALALKEFQRSVPKVRTDLTKPFERLPVDGNYDADNRKALDALADERRRPKFGDPAAANLDDHHDKTADDLKAVSAVLQDRTKSLIAWVDARHFYTDAGADQAQVKLDNYHGGMENGDALATVDAASTCRPWIPLVASLRLLSKGKKLSDPIDPEPTEAKMREAMANAIGPLRVDWSFEEIGPDLSRVKPASYKKGRARTLRYLEWALNTTSALYTRKDTNRKVRYTNCPAGNGGIRAAVADYYKSAFGSGDDESLWPWPAVADPATETVASIVHDHLISSQPADAEPLYADWRGRAGVYFCPSTIAGDGYRVRARVRFAKAGNDYEFPNLDALARRYPRLPQAHTAALRVWRRASVRATVEWTSTATDHVAGMKAFYHPSHVQFVAEADAGGNVTTYRPLDLIDTNAQETAFKALITGKVAQNYHKNHPELIKFDNNYCYPYFDENNLGWPWPSDPNAADAKALIAEADTDTWRTFREVLLYNLVRRVEEKDGKLRGHVLVVFDDTPTFYAQRYACDKCVNTYWYLEKAAGGGVHNGKNCASGCGGRVREGRCRSKYRCSRPTCNHLTGFQGPDTWPGGGKWNGKECPACHQMTLQISGAPDVQLAKQVVARPRAMVNAGCGLAGGGIWLPDSFTPWEWAHEVGHNRHLEHAADAPVGGRGAEKDKLHDSEVNTLPGANFVVGDTAPNKRWDRCCVMSYVDSSPKYDNTIDLTYFCGKCVLRNAGWKVEAIKDSANNTGPGGTQTDD